MERESRMKKQAKRKKEISENRSPLQDLNGVLIHRKNCRKNCTNSSTEAPNGCLRSLLSSSSSSSTSTETLLKKKPKSQFNFTNCTTQKSAAASGSGSTVLRSEENDIRKKPLPQKPRQNHPPFLYQRKNNKKPTIFRSQKSTLSSGPRYPVNVLKKGFKEFGEKPKNLQESGPGKSTVELFGIDNKSNILNSVGNFTPAGKIACGSDLEFANLDDNKNIREDSSSRTIDSNSSNATKTPPVEASVSPEIQCGSHSKMLVSTAAVTPICYGAGHLVSGVTDKRKCRSRGILTVGRENANLFEYESNEGKLINDSRLSLIPMPAEASLHWLLSPCDEERGGNGSDLEDRLEHCGIMPGNSLVTIDLESSASTLSGNASGFVCDSDSYGVSSNVGDTASTGKTRNVLLSSRKQTSYFLADTPYRTPTGKAVNSQEGKNYSYDRIGDNAAASVGSLSSGNVIQTPDSNSSSERHSNDHKHHKCQIESELDSMTEIIQGMSLSARRKMSICDAPGLDVHCTNLASHSHSIDLNELPPKNLDKSSSIFDSMSENLSISQMRISWRDGLVSRTFGMDESDCCRCFSDEEIDAVRCSNEHLVSYPMSESNAPVLLESESSISEKQKARSSSPQRQNSCAESICTNGGGLIASGDSDWTICYKNHFF